MSHLRRSLSKNSMKKINVRFDGKIVQVLQEYSKGILGNYNMLITQVSDTTLRSTEIIDWLQQSIENVHLLDKTHKPMVDALLKIQWMKREKEVVSAFHNFVIALVTSNPIHLRTVILKLVNCFTPEKSNTNPITISVLTEEEIFKTIHSILKSIFTIIPLSTSIAEKVFSDCFPYFRKPQNFLVCYVENLLIITTYFPGSIHFFLELIVKHIIEIDVHSPRHEIEELEDDLENMENMFDMEMDDVEKKEENKNEMKHQLADKLDVLMNILFKYIHGACYKKDELQLDDSKKLLNCLLSVFDNRILPVDGTVHTQFLLFFISSFQLELCSIFLKHCWNKVLSPHIAGIYRQSSCCYMGSLLARGNFISLKTVAKWLDNMTSWTNKYIKENTDVMSGDSFCCDIQKHGTFYSVSQAIFYVIIFRHKEILDSKLGRNYILGLNLQHLITCHLNPLQACQVTIVNLFSSTMRIHQLVYCDTIVDRNNRQMISSVASPNNPLNSFFPFDPYLLKRSSSFIEPLYKEWEGSVPRLQKQELNPDDDVSMEEFLDKIDNNNFTPNSLNKNIYAASPLEPGFNYLPNSPF